MSEDLVTVEFNYDFASPYSYLADCQLDWVLEDSRAEVVRVPVYLRGFDAFKEKMPYTSSKAAYKVRDMQRTAAVNDIPLTTPKVMPVNGLYMLRGAVFLKEKKELLSKYRHAAFKAAWVDQRDVSSADAVADIAAEIGIDRAEFLTGISDKVVKDELRANTESAIARGAFGVPTFFVGDELFFGQDRLDQVRKLVDRLASAD
jgi:2-hydroxychromene-2-carboxylate isomerase